MTKILLAEDEGFIASLYKLELERHSVEVKIVGNGKEALAALEEDVFDILLMDLIMPDMDGFELLKNIKEKKIILPVIVLTNLSQNVDQQKCAEYGVKDYLVKADIDAPEVWNRVQKVLQLPPATT